MLYGLYKPFNIFLISPELVPKLVAYLKLVDSLLIIHYMQSLNRIVYNLLGKDFIIEGVSNNLFFLRRATERQRLLISNILWGRVAIRYTECLHHPDLWFTAGGRLGSMIGQFDAWLGEFPWLGFFIAR